MAKKSKLIALSTALFVLFISLFTISVSAVIVPPPPGDDGFLVYANNGVKLYGGTVFGDYTDTHTRNDEYYGGYTKFQWFNGINIRLKLEIPYSYTWKADHVYFYIKMSNGLIDTRVSVYYTNGGNEDVTYIASNGHHTIPLNTDLEVAYIIFKYDTIITSGWMKIDYLHIYYYN